MKLALMRVLLILRIIFGFLSFYLISQVPVGFLWFYGLGNWGWDQYGHWPPYVIPIFLSLAITYSVFKYFPKIWISALFVFANFFAFAGGQMMFGVIRSSQQKLKQTETLNTDPKHQKSFGTSTEKE